MTERKADDNDDAAAAAEHDVAQAVALLKQWNTIITEQQHDGSAERVLAQIIALWQSTHDPELKSKLTTWLARVHVHVEREWSRRARRNELFVTVYARVCLELS